MPRAFPWRPSIDSRVRINVSGADWVLSQQPQGREIWGCIGVRLKLARAARVMSPVGHCSDLARCPTSVRDAQQSGGSPTPLNRWGHAPDVTRNYERPAREHRRLEPT